MKTGLTEIIFILDKSGSMCSVANDTVGGFNEFVTKQKAEPGEAQVTLVQFDNHYHVTYSGKNIKDVPELDSRTYCPSGMTALYDAIGKTVHDVGQRLSNTPENERPEKVVVVVLTDGEENSSREYSVEKVRESVTHQESVYNWQFVFIGADIDSFGNARGMGINLNSTMNFSKSAAGIHATYSSLNDKVGLYRRGTSSSVAFDANDYQQQKDLGVQNP